MQVQGIAGLVRRAQGGHDGGVRKIVDIGPSEDPRRAVRSYLLMAAIPLIALIIGLLIVLL